MSANFAKRFHMQASRIVSFSAPRWLTYLYVSVLSLTYIVVTVHTPLSLLAGAAHDDGLFIKLGRSLAEGRWLGGFNQFTLMKGPGYPAFLAVANWLGISASVAHALFYCAAVIFFVALMHRFIKSYLLSGLLLALMLWHPLPFTVHELRILRDQIYPGQLLIAFAAAAGALLYGHAQKQRMMFAVSAGLFLGWFWLTREEGGWIIPAAVLLVAAAAIDAFRAQGLRRFAAALVALIVVFASIQVGFRTINWAVYGMFVGVDSKEASFQRALLAINSVRSGGIKPFVSITHAAMKRVDTVSPAFASLAPYFDGPGKGWETWGCRVYLSACGEFGSGWFMWALRDAVAAAGHYSSPAEASAFYGRIADEITFACARSALECSPQIITEMPPINWPEVAKGLPALYAEAFDKLLYRHPPLQFNPSIGSEADLAAALRFLNYPRVTRPTDDALAYTLSGWYYKSGRKWFSATVKLPNGSLVGVQVVRKASEDIQAAFKDTEAAQQRFDLHTQCNDECTLELQSQDGEVAQKKLAEFKRDPVSFALGQGKVYIDITAIQGAPAADWMEDVSGHVRQAILNNYAHLFVPVLILGAICLFAASALYWRHVFFNTCYILALCSWTLVIVRTSLIVLIAATSFPALSPHYLWPSHIFLITGAFFSCAAWLQLSGFRPIAVSVPAANAFDEDSV